MSERYLVDVPSKPFSIEIDRNSYGQMSIFTPTGEYPAELHANANATDGIKSGPVRVVTKYVQAYLT